MDEAPCSEDRLDLSVEVFHTDNGDEGMCFNLVGERDNSMKTLLVARDKDNTRASTIFGHAIKNRFW